MVDDKVSAMLDDPKFWEIELRDPDPVEVEETQEEVKEEIKEEAKEVSEELQEEVKEEIKEEVKEEPQEEKITKSEYYARLIEKDKQIRALKEQIKGKDTIDYKELAKKDPAAVINELGIDMSQIIDLWVGSDTEKSNNNNSLNNREIEELKKEVASIRKEKEEFLAQQAIQQEKMRISSFIKKDPTRWELLNARGEEAIGLIFEHAREYYQETGEVPDIDIVADVVEQNYTDSFLENYEQMTKLNKIKQRLTPTQAKQVEEKKEQHKPQATLQASSETAYSAAKTREEAEQRAKALLDEMNLFGD